MPKSKSVKISLDEYHRLQEVEKRCGQFRSAFDGFNDSHNDLLDAHQLAAEKYRTNRDPSLKREAWTDWLVATMDFMRKMPNADGAANRIVRELLGCLGDLNAGRKPLLLKPADKEPERTNTNAYLADLGMGAALVDILHDGRQGMPLPKAATEVVRLFERYGGNLPKQIGTNKANRKLSESLINFRKKMNRAMDDSPKYGIAKRFHHSVMERYRRLQDERGHSKADAAKILINSDLPRLMGKKVHSTPS